MFSAVDSTQPVHSRGSCLCFSPVPTPPPTHTDFWGSDVVVHNMTVYNWDDVVCPKPCNPSRCWLNARMQAEERARRGITHHDGLVCTQNILAYDINITFGVGMTIGSVPPALGTNCIRDVVFRDVNFEWPLKGGCDILGTEEPKGSHVFVSCGVQAGCVVSFCVFLCCFRFVPMSALLSMFSNRSCASTLHLSECVCV